MSELLELETFAPCVGEKFTLQATDELVLEMTLAEARATTSERLKEEHREPFALVFVGPPDPILPQRIYSLAHPAAGTHDIFLVPVARDEQGTSYEAIFN